MQGFKEQSFKKGFQGSTATVGMSPLGSPEPAAKAAFRLAVDLGIAEAMLRYQSQSAFLVCSDGRGILLRLRYAFLKGDRHVSPYLDREDDRCGQQKRSYGHVRDG